MRSVLLASVLIWGCGPSFEQLRVRELCYSHAEASAQARVDRECEGRSFSECPAADGILAELQASQEACQ